MALSEIMQRNSRECVTRAKARAGAGWSLLGAELQQALIAREALSVIMANDEAAGYQKAAEFACATLAQIA